VSEERPDSRRGVAAEVRRGVTRLAHRLRVERPSDALTANKISVLSHLHRNGPRTPGEIAAAEHQLPQSLTRVFSDLQISGLVSRSPSPRDGRESVLSLTWAGESALARDMAQRDAWLSEALFDFTPAEVDLLRIAAGLLDRIADLPATDSMLPDKTA
jgi:DNA-binding MarR family transcriptional regulator